MNANEIHNKRAFHNPTWVETDETRKVERDYAAEARCRAWLAARQQAWREGKEVEFLAAQPADKNSEYRG
jgi:hypothetical protein